MKNVNVANIRIDAGDIFEYWVSLTKPLHKLTDYESIILQAFLKKRHQYAKSIVDDEIVDKFLFSSETRKEIMTEIGCKMGSFQNYLSSMRQKGVIVDNKINKKLIPNFTDGTGNFRLIFNFIISGQGNF